MTQDDWHLITYRPNQSARAERNLIEQGVQCYLPRLVVIEKDRPRARELFVGYGFIRPGKVSLSAIASTPGVGKLPHFNERPALISDEWISAIKGQVKTMNSNHRKLDRMLNQKVVVTVGVTQDLHSLVVEVDDKRGMVRILYFMLGQPQMAWIELSHIKSHA
jgi:transcriptional antiterminator RfaH